MLVEEVLVDEVAEVLDEVVKLAPRLDTVWPRLDTVWPRLDTVPPTRPVTAESGPALTFFTVLPRLCTVEPTVLTAEPTVFTTPPEVEPTALVAPPGADVPPCVLVDTEPLFDELTVDDDVLLLFELLTDTLTVPLLEAVADEAAADPAEDLTVAFTAVEFEAPASTDPTCEALFACTAADTAEPPRDGNPPELPTADFATCAILLAAAIGDAR